MAKQNHTVDKNVSSGRVGVAVMEGQTLHHGHVGVLSYMAATCDTSIIAMGSCNKSGILGHPFTFEQRKAMVEGACGTNFKFIQLNDIDAYEDESAWARYVLERIAKAGLPAPTDYFSGSEIDASYYGGHFPLPTMPGVVSTGNGLVTTYEGVMPSVLDPTDVAVRRLHIVDRTKLGLPSGRDLRYLIERREFQRWSPFVPARLWRYIELNYPPSIRLPVVAKDIPHPDDFPYPVGTRLKLRHEPDNILVLQDDRAWRPLREGPDEKTAAALKMHANDKE